MQWCCIFDGFNRNCSSKRHRFAEDSLVNGMIRRLRKKSEVKEVIDGASNKKIASKKMTTRLR